MRTLPIRRAAPSLALVGVSLILLTHGRESRAAYQLIDYSQLVPKLSGEVPREVPPFPFSAFPVDTRPMFDHFAWQNFIALMWPSRAEDLGRPFRPGDPAVFGRYDAERQPVWMRWKSAFDLFPQDGSMPPAWEEPNGTDVCRNIPGTQSPQLDMLSKFGSVADEIDEAFGGPLPDQTGLFTRYEVRVNRVEYDFVRSNGYYDRSKWPAPGGPPISFPASTAKALGSIEIKAAWRDLARVPERFHERFFTTETLAALPGTCSLERGTQRTVCDCARLKVGLVGFHITHKTTNFPQWVWSTFEQVDNLGEDPTTPPDMQPSYYDPELYKRIRGVTRANPPQHPGSSRVPAADDFDSTPINVVRLSAIPSTPRGHSTVDVNRAFRALVKGTVWANYQLVGSQWSTLPSSPPQTPLYNPAAKGQDFGCEDGMPAAQGGLAFPACQVSNVTMETYHQYDSCQNCHQGAQRAGADYSWILANRAYTPPAAERRR